MSNVYQFKSRFTSDITSSPNHKSDDPLRIIQETAATKEGEEMDDSVKIMLDRLDKDIRDHKQEVRDRDARIQTEFKEREKRIYDDAASREQRILSAINESAIKSEKQMDAIRQELTEMNQEVAGNTKHVQSLVTANIWGMIATIIAIAGLAVTVFFALKK